MKPEWSNGIVEIYQGDCIDVLASMEAESIQCVVTSPPYWGLRDYGTGDDALGLEPTPELYVEHIVEIFREVWRVLRDDGTLWLNLGDSYYASGWECSRRNVIGAGSVPANDRKSGRYAAGLKSKDLVGIPWRVAFALQADGWYLRSDIIWSKPNPMPESVTDRPTKAHEYIFLLTKKEKYYYAADTIREPLAESTLPRLNRGVGEFHKNVNGAPGQTPHTMNQPRHHGQRYSSVGVKGRNKRTVWTVATQPYAGAHFATFPTKLIEPCILAGCPEGGAVLDPFAGSGTVGDLAQTFRRKAILIELNPEYVELATKRIEAVTLPMDLS